jgi:hypothetical protein
MKKNTLFIAVNPQDTMLVSVDEGVLREYLQQDPPKSKKEDFTIIKYSFHGCGRQINSLNHRLTQFTPTQETQKLIEDTFANAIQGLDGEPIKEVTIRMGRQKESQTIGGPFKFVRRELTQEISVGEITHSELVREILAAAV